MSLNKKVLAGAIASLLLSANAGAVVLGEDDARQYASELEKPVVLTDTEDTIEVELGYNFSAGEVRYGRLECTDNIEINDPTVDAGGSPLITVGSVNGAGTEALFFSLTAADDLDGAATDEVVIGVDADNELQDNAAVNCSFSIYDQPSQAQAGGTSGRIHTTGMQPFIESVSGLAFTSDAGLATAWVQAPGGAYTAFVDGDSAFGTLTLQAVEGVLNADGTQIGLFDILDEDATSVIVEGDFTAAEDVTLGGASADADELEDGVAVFAITTELDEAVLDYVENGEDAIAASTYTARLDAEAADGFELGSIPSRDAGEIDRDGTELQAPLAQRPNGWISRMVLTNTGNQERAYTVRVLGETGNDIGTGDLTGTIPANGTVVVDLDTMLTSFSGKARATLVANVAAPTGQIQGLYQIVNSASGSISNHVMVRPGTN